MLDENDSTTTDQTTSTQRTGDSAAPSGSDQAPAPAKKAAKRAPRKTAKKAAASVPDPAAPEAANEPADQPASEPVPGSDPAPVKKTAAKRATAKKATAKKTTAKKTTTRRTTKKVAAGADGDAPAGDPTEAPVATPAGSAPEAPLPETAVSASESAAPAAPSLLFQAPDATAAPRRRRRTAGAAAPVEDGPVADSAGTDSAGTDSAGTDSAGTDRAGTDSAAATTPAPPEPAASSAAEPETETDPEAPSPRRARSRRTVKTTTMPAAAAPEPAEESVGDTVAAPTGPAAADQAPDVEVAEPEDAEETEESDDEQDGDGQSGNRRRRRRGGRRRRRSGGGDGPDDDTDSSEDGSADGTDAAGEQADAGDDSAEQGSRQGGRGSGQRNQRNQRSGTGQKSAGQGGNGPDRSDSEDQADGQDDGAGSRRRRRRRRAGEEGDGGAEEPNTVVRVRKPRTAEDAITSLHGSTRLEAKKQRRREGREAGRRRAPIVSEAEFLARREAVDRVMVIRQKQDLTQIAVLEDKVLVEHYVARESQTSLIGNVYLGRVQNVLPSMEAAFIDIGKGRNAVLYAGEVNWDSLGAGNGPRKIEQVLKSGQPILVQVSKDPIGHKGARLTSQVSLPGRFLVYVPDGTTSGISRKLPDTERSRLKTLLKEIVPDRAGVIVRTAAEGASEEELTLDVERLTARWSDIEAKAAKGNAPQLLYGEPDLTLKVVRDLFTEDFGTLVVSGDEAWDLVDGYVKHVAPDLEERLERYAGDQDVFAAYRIDEQIAKGLDRKVWLPSGGSLVIDRTEAMTVVDVNTGKFTGSGGNLEETVTKNNLEAAEEIVRQLRLRDIGGIIVVDFIDMVLESNRDLVLRRLVECLGRDRTRHQVAEVTSLGLVQMTRKRIGTGLLESFSENCDHCQGRGVVISHEPVEPHAQQDDEPRRGRRGRGRDETTGNGRGNGAPAPSASPSPKDVAAMAKHEHKPVAETTEDRPADEAVERPAFEAVDQGDGPTSTRTSESTSEPTSEPEDGTPSADEVVPEVAQAEPPVTDEPVQPGAADPAEPAEVPEPVEVPLVVATTRRRVARRPAGSAGTPTVITAPVTPAAPAVEPTAPADVPDASADSADEPAQAVAAAGPRLVTSSRRKVVRRPAGPPVG